MTRELHPRMRCPACASEFSFHPAVESPATTRAYGELACVCGAWPVVDGIARLLADVLRAPILDRIRRADLRAALAMALEWPRLDRTQDQRRRIARALAATGMAPLRALSLSITRNDRDAMLDDAPSFSALAERLDPGIWGDWLQYRFSMRALHPLYPLRCALEQGQPTLDIGSGVGHGSYLLAARVGGASLACIDSIFAYVWLLRERFVPQAFVVCANAASGLPFQNGTFRQVVASDTFHFVKGKQRLAREIARVGMPGVRVVLSHLANRQVPQEHHGTPLDPAGYRSLFPGGRCHLYANAALTAAWRPDASLDLSIDTADERLNDVHGLSLVASADPDVFAMHDRPLESALAAGAQLVVNPRLSPRNDAGGVVLERTAAHASFDALDADLTPVTPVRLPGASLDAVGLHLPDQDTVRRLWSQFVLVDAPAGFCAAARLARAA